MAGTNINLKTDYIEIEDEGAVAALERLAALGGNLEAPFKDIGEYLMQRTEERFDTEAGPGGIEWPDIAAETRKRKKHPKILTESRDLRSSFSYAASADELVFGTNVLYAATHQFGDPSRNIPARPFLGWDEEDGVEAVEIVLEHIDAEWWRQ